jgi:hypothetical protein
VVEHNGVAVTTPLRTVTDLGRTLPLPEAVGVADSARRQRLVRLPALRGAAATARGAGCGPLIRCIALADPRSGSLLESYTRVLLVLAGHGPEQTQYVVRRPDGGFIARVDFAWPSRRVLVEVDGFAYHADRVSYRNDRRRQNALEIAGWLVLRLTWEDVLGRPDEVVRVVRQALGEIAAA